MRRLFLGALAVAATTAAAVAASPAPAQACGMLPFIMSPAEGATVPTTARVWIGRDFSCDAERYRLETEDGEQLALRTVDAGGTCVVEPLAPLPADTEITVRGPIVARRFRTASATAPRPAVAPPRIASLTLDCAGGHCGLSFDASSPRGPQARLYYFENGRLLDRPYDYASLEALLARGRTCFAARELLSTGVLSPPSPPACVDLGELARRHDQRRAMQPLTGE